MLPSNNTDTPAPQTQKWKKDRACDACRRRKTKCNGPSIPNNVCMNCFRTGKSCTYIEASKPRGPSKAYVTSLEDRLEALEALLRQIRPGVDVSRLFGLPIVRNAWKDENTPSLILAPLGGEPATPNSIGLDSSSAHVNFRSQSREKRSLNTLAAGSLSERSVHSFSDEDNTSEASSSPETEDTEDTVVTSLVGRTKITLLAAEKADSAADYNIRFHGRSDTAGLIEVTRQFKQMHIEETIVPIAQENTSLMDAPSLVTARTRRPQFWQTPTWELGHEGARIDDPVILQVFIEKFPPLDLANRLIEYYFRYSNTILPLLHRPTFDQQWQEQLHHRNIWFACVCMSMFAVASRWYHDEYILPRNRNEGADWSSAGRRYFDVASEMHRVRRSLFHPASLFEVQSLVLMAMYLSGSNAYPATWLLITTALRKTQDVGAHRKGVYRAEANVDDELWKRAFWNLVVLDRLGAAVLGRSYGLSDEDFDLDLPLEVDDDYWEARSGTHRPFTQPAGIPSTVTAFNQLIKLTQIMAFALRTLYAVDKSKVYHGLIALDQKDVVNHLSRAMDGWEAGVPEHLRWKDDIGVSLFSSQSANLFTTYHMTRILVYRPLTTSAASFLSRSVPNHTQSGRTSHVSSLIDSPIDICSDAARSCARILNTTSLQGIGCFYPPNAIHISYTCAAFLVQIGWRMKLQGKDPQQSGREDPIAQHIEERLPDIQVFLLILEALKGRWDIVDSLLRDINECLSGLENEIQTNAPPALVHADSPSSKTSQTKLHRQVNRSFSLVDHYTPQGFPSDSSTVLKRARYSGVVTPKSHHNTIDAGLPHTNQGSFKLLGLPPSHRTRAVSLSTLITHRNVQSLPKSTKLMRTVSFPSLSYQNSSQNLGNPFSTRGNNEGAVTTHTKYRENGDFTNRPRFDF